jgi:hypothetical protein
MMMAAAAPDWWPRTAPSLARPLVLCVDGLCPTTPGGRTARPHSRRPTFAPVWCHDERGRSHCPITLEVWRSPRGRLRALNNSAIGGLAGVTLLLRCRSQGGPLHYI